jgi:actin-related protein 3
MAIFNKMSGGDDKMEAKVAQNLVQRCAVWFGGSVLGSKDYFPKVCKTREQYAEIGPSICRHNAVFAAPF